MPWIGKIPGSGNGYHPGIHAWRIPWTEEHSPWCLKASDSTEQLAYTDINDGAWGQWEGVWAWNQVCFCAVVRQWHGQMPWNILTFHSVPFPAPRRLLCLPEGSLWWRQWQDPCSLSLHVCITASTIPGVLDLFLTQDCGELRCALGILAAPALADHLATATPWMLAEWMREWINKWVVISWESSVLLSSSRGCHLSGPQEPGR